MKRNNAAVRIPPKPPSSSGPISKQVQVGAPKPKQASSCTSSDDAGPPNKPKRGLSKQPSQPFPQNTLSDVLITFGKPESMGASSSEEQIGNGGNSLQTRSTNNQENLYENLSTGLNHEVSSCTFDNLQLAEALEGSSPSLANKGTSNNTPVRTRRSSYENIPRGGHQQVSNRTFDNLQLGRPFKVSSHIRGEKEEGNNPSVQSGNSGYINLPGGVANMTLDNFQLGKAFETGTDSFETRDAIQCKTGGESIIRQSARAHQFPTLDNMRVGPGMDPVYENLPRINNPQVMPDDLVKKATKKMEQRSVQNFNTKDGPVIKVDPPTTSSLNLDSASLPLPPRGPAQNTIYKDPASLFESEHLDRLSSVAVNQLFELRSKSTSTLLDSETSTLQDSGSDVSSTWRSSQSAGSELEDFVVVRRGGRGSRERRAVSEIMTSSTTADQARKRNSVWFEAIKQSLVGAINAAKTPDTNEKPNSIFYVTGEKEDDDECDDGIYASLPDECDTITGKLKRNLPESVVKNLTPTVFSIPQSDLSIFYTDDHVYSSSESLGARLTFPSLSVQNVGYGDPTAKAVEQAEDSLLVNQSPFIPQPDPHSSNIDKADDGSSHIESAYVGTILVGDHDISRDISSDSLENSVSIRSSAPKQRLSRVSQMIKNFETTE